MKIKCPNCKIILVESKGDVVGNVSRDIPPIINLETNCYKCGLTVIFSVFNKLQTEGVIGPYD